MLLMQYSTLKYNLIVGMSLASCLTVGCCRHVQKEPGWAGGITYHPRETKFQITDQETIFTHAHTKLAQKLFHLF